MTQTSPSDVRLAEELSTVLRGDLVSRGQRGYDEDRRLYNAMIDKKPALIAHCADAGDVAEALRFARGHRLDVAVRCGAHNGGGLGSVDDGLVIDLSRMRGVRVDPKARTALVLGGTLLGDVDHATHAYGLAAPFGIISTTGVGGLTLGGGIGHLTRTLGLSIDNLLSADVVLSDGRFVTASEDENPDLLWALRGGGGNFGVVTSFTFRLHEVSDVLAGPMLWPLERTAEVLKWYREFILSAPEDLNGFFAFLTVPPAPPFPEELHMKKMCGVVWCWAGDPARQAEVLAPARDLEPVLDGVMPLPLPALQSAFDALYPAGDQWYWRADFVQEIPDEAVEAHAYWGERLPTWKSTMHLYPVNGAAARVGQDDTAWAYRDANWAQTIVGVDPDPANAELVRRWTVDYHDALHPYSMGGAYVNMMMADEGQERVRATYRGNYDRLAQVKRTYDPENLLHVNQNIRPA